MIIVLKTIWFHFFLIAAVLFCSDVTAQNLESILQRHATAHSDELWEQVRTFTAQGLMITSDGEHRIQLLAKKPNKIKLISVQKNFVYAYDGNDAWGIKKGQEKVVDLDTDEAEALIILFHFGSPLQGKERLKYRGKVEMDEKTCYWISQNAGKFAVDYYIDTSSDLLHKINSQYEYRGKLRMISRKIIQYRNYSGIKIPAVIEVKTNALVWEFAFDEMLIGDGFGNSIFEKPE